MTKLRPDLHHALIILWKDLVCSGAARPFLSFLFSGYFAGRRMQKCTTWQSGWRTDPGPGLDG